MSSFFRLLVHICCTTLAWFGPPLAQKSGIADWYRSLLFVRARCGTVLRSRDVDTAELRSFRRCLPFLTSFTSVCGADGIFTNTKQRTFLHGSRIVKLTSIFENPSTQQIL
jgi:hypothetical protein